MINDALKKRDPVKWLVIFLMIIIQTALLYIIPRSNFILTYGSFLILFALYFYIIKSVNRFSFSLCIGLAVFLRVLAVFSLPELSDDYFRFIWDGKMIVDHINPFQFTPQEFLALHHADTYMNYLYTNMNSQEYHSVYPPVLQYIFCLAVFLFPQNAYGSAIIMKLFILIAECVSIRVLFLYALKKNLPERNILWYVLNPMIIVELTGNVHFEALMLCFLILSFYLLEKKKLLLPAIFWALAIATKMIPLMLGPLILRYLGFKKFILYGIVSVSCLLLVFVPFYNSHLFADIDSSLKLFYHLFEFNGSIFYFIRWIGYRTVHYDVIEETASLLGIISLLLILMISWWPSRSFSLFNKSLWILLVYFLFATMVHPWYISSLLLVSVFSKYKFAFLFSLLILLSYYPYSLKVYNESNWIILVEYGLLFCFIIFEYSKRKLQINVVNKKGSERYF